MVAIFDRSENLCSAALERALLGQPPVAKAQYQRPATTPDGLNPESLHRTIVDAIMRSPGCNPTEVRARVIQMLTTPLRTPATPVLPGPVRYAKQAEPVLPVVRVEASPDGKLRYIKTVAMSR
jgi:hypothetical protein